ncbi:MAG: hypothetical protein CL756_04595 [Chloroflexi bacterium]|nr:hypothetical protein [Chloroflexota bacterium]
MAQLSSADMRSTASAGEYASQKRPDIFDLKIKDKRPFIVGSSESAPKVIGISYDRKNEILTYQKQGSKTVYEAKRSQIFKDKDFGGGGRGSGGGQKETALTESMQCYYCSYVFNVKKGACKEVSTAQLKSAAKYVDASESLADCLKKGPGAWLEDDVYVKTANKVWEKYGRGMTRNGIVTFHRDSAFMKGIYSAYKACLDLDRKSSDPQAPGSFDANKWNPGDIWATTLPVTSKPLKDFQGSWGELNMEVEKLAKAGKVLGISLKRIGKGGRATSKEFNKSSLTKPDIKYESWGWGKTGNFFNSQDIYMSCDGGLIQFRTFNKETSWQGQITGSAAAGGKVSGGNVDYYCKEIFGKEIYGGRGSEAPLLSQINSDPKWPSKAYALYKKHNAKSKPNVALIPEATFLENWKGKEEGFRNSKSMCLMFLDVFEGTGTSKKKKDELCKLMFLYASSATDQSSFFVKIS